MAVLVRQLRDSSDEIPEAIADLQSVELTNHEWEVLYAHCQREVSLAVNQEPVVRTIRKFGIPALVLSVAAFCGAIFERTIHSRMESRLNEVVAKQQSDWIKQESSLSQANFRIQELESNLSSAAYLDTSGNRVSIPGVPVADKNHQVQWINFDAAKMALEGRKVESIRLEVRSSLKPNVQGPTSTEQTVIRSKAEWTKLPNSTGNGVANSSTMDSAKPVQSSH